MMQQWRKGGGGGGGGTCGLPQVRSCEFILMIKQLQRLEAGTWFKKQITSLLACDRNEIKLIFNDQAFQ